MINKINDQQLIDELKARFDERTRAFREMEKLNQQLLEVNKKLSESEKLKSNFLSNARNEIINPMSAIMNLSQAIAADQHLQPDKMRQMAKVIFTEAFDLNFQLTNIFASAEIEAGAAFCEFYNLHLGNFISSELEKYKDKAAEKNIQLNFENKLSQENQQLKTDPSKLKIIFDNLIANAINWSVENGKVTVTAENTESGPTLHFKDTGPGIEPEFHEAVFDRFKTLDTSVHSRNKGHGLGLSLVKACTELLGGRVKIKSSDEQGSCFSVELPLSPLATGNDGVSENGQDFLFDDTELF
jgi:signal transduction histidine kinase